ncbi:MAG: biopolymer transporter ExbD [Gammaproteobacteria bacterium]|nr:biopolymer transporter ExbD [Gammaproteobacteria bacterium]
MKFKRPGRSGRALVAVELTPLIDVVFLLLIFFMVSTTFVRETALGIRLPNVEGDAVSREPVDIEVQISRGGDYVVDGARLQENDAAALRVALQAALARREGPGASMLVVADSQTRHDAVVRVLGAARSVGLTDVDILTDAADSSEGEDGH